MIPDVSIESHSIRVIKQAPNRVRFVLWHSVKNLLAFIGLVTILFAIFLYYKGQQVVYRLDPQFPMVFGKFIETIIKNDVANAMITKMPLTEGVTVKQAIESMKLRANLMNVKLLGSYPLSENIRKSTGNKLNFIEIFEFCDTSMIASILQHNPAFAPQIPCRIAVYEDIHEKIWFATVNLELFIYGSRHLSPELKMQLLKIQDNLLKIMGAGVTGAL